MGGVTGGGAPCPQKDLKILTLRILIFGHWAEPPCPQKDFKILILKTLTFLKERKGKENIMSHYIALTATWFRAGGPFMWVLLLFLACAVAVAIERLIFLYFICPRDTSALVDKLKTAIG